MKSLLPLLFAVFFVSSTVHAAEAGDSKLDKRLIPVARAAASHSESTLRDRALADQAARRPSAFKPHWNTANQVQVYLHYDPASGTPDLEQLRALGVTGIIPSPALGVIQAWVPASALTTVGDLPGVQRVALPRYAVVKRLASSQTVSRAGSVDTQGDRILGAKSFRSTTGISGKGISVGVISGGDEHLAASQATHDLPDTVWDDPKDKGGSGGFGSASSGDEGTAMMEIVYDLAPGIKELGFCGPGTSVEFLTCLDDLKSGISANIIVDDLGFPGGAMFTTDNFTKGVKSFAGNNPSIRLVTAAGNDGTAYWQGSWSPLTVSTTVNGVSYTQALNFGSNASPIPYLHINANPGDNLDYVVEWADPWDDNASANDPNDYDVVVFDSPSGGTAVACNQGIYIGPDPNDSGSTRCDQTNGSDRNTPGPQPVQGSGWTANVTDYYLQVFLKHGSPSKRIKVVVFDEQSGLVTVAPATVGSIFGQAALAYPTEITVGAVYAGNLGLEDFSSRGPVEQGTGSTFNSVMKPDFVAPDGVSVTGAGGFEDPFFGTSAAAPHIAGIMALLMSGYPDRSPYTLLKESATPYGSPIPNGNAGYGLPNLQTLLDDGQYPTPTTVIQTPADNLSVETGSKVSFKGSCTSHGNGTVSYDWNFGSGSGIADSKSAAPSVTFAKAGTYDVTLTCTAGSVSGEDKVTVTVSTPSSGGGTTAGLTLLALATAAIRRRRALSRR